MRKQRAPRVDSRLNDMRRGGQKRNIPRKQKPLEGQSSESPQNPYPKRRTSLQAGLAVLGGRTAGALSRRLHLGGGTSIAGLVAQKVYPDIVGHLATQLEFGSVIVTGTNGKTTTSAFIAAILSDAGLRVWRNREGSNLMGGIASSLIMRAMPNGQMRRAGQAMTILEVDEAVVPQVVETVSPRVAVFTNLFRDQLDRYGEVDDVAAHWQHAVTNLSAGSILVVNADDPATANLGKLFKGRVLYYGIDDPSLDLTKQQGRPERHQVSDARTCPQCGGDYTYDMRFFSHMGHYHCTSCGNERPQLDVRVVKAQTENFDRLRIGISSSLLPATQPREIVIPLPGIYNIYNALAAVTAAQALEIGWEPIVSGIEQFKPIFGRGERIQVEGRTLRLLLAKNPTGFNEVLRTLFSDEGIARNVLFVLNNNIADGRDVSWIWDVDFEQVVGRTATLVAAGSRALDLALRLKYAGISQQEVIIVPPAPLRATKRARVLNNHNKRASKNSKMGDAVVTETIEQVPSTKRANRYGIAEALDAAVQLTPAGETLFVVPTYTGLLEIHGELERRGLTPHYWEERDS